MGGVHDHPTLSHISARRAGFLDRRDARAKVLAAIGLVLAIVLAPQGEPRRVLLLGAGVLAFAALGGAPLPRVLARAAVVLPFALLGSAFLPFAPGRVLWEGPFHLRVSAEGLARAGDVTVRATLSGVTLAALALATDLPDLVRGLAGLGVPRILVVTMTFTIRYLALLREEAARLALAREMKTFGWRPVLTLTAMGHSAGTLFVRTYERAERVHAAMAARGFTGTFPVLAAPRVGTADLLLVGGAVAWGLAADLFPLVPAGGAR